MESEVIHHHKVLDDGSVVEHTYCFNQIKYNELSAQYLSLDCIPELKSYAYLGEINFEKFHYLQMQMVAHIGGKSPYSQAATDGIYDCVGIVLIRGRDNAALVTHALASEDFGCFEDYLSDFTNERTDDTRVHLVTCYNSPFLLSVIDILRSFNLEISTLNRRKLPNGQHVISEKYFEETFPHCKYFMPENCRNLVRPDYTHGLEDPFLHTYTDNPVELFVDIDLGYVGFNIPSVDVKKFNVRYWEDMDSLLPEERNMIIQTYPHLQRAQKEFFLRVKQKDASFYLVS